MGASSCHAGTLHCGPADNLAHELLVMRNLDMSSYVLLYSPSIIIIIILIITMHDG